MQIGDIVKIIDLKFQGFDGIIVDTVDAPFVLWTVVIFGVPLPIMKNFKTYELEVQPPKEISRWSFAISEVFENSATAADDESGDFVYYEDHQKALDLANRKLAAALMFLSHHNELNAINHIASLK